MIKKRKNEEGVHRGEDAGKRRTAAGGVGLLVEERDSYGAGADGAPVVRSPLPPLFGVVAEVAVENAAFDFGAAARDNARVETVAEEVERLRDVESSFRGRICIICINGDAGFIAVIVDACLVKTVLACFCIGIELNAHIRYVLTYKIP